MHLNHREFNKILEKSEKIFWEGKPKFLPFFMRGTLLSFFGVLLIIGGLLILQRDGGGTFPFIFHYFVLGAVLVVVFPIYQALVYRHTYYAITNKRVLIQAGLIGRDFEIVDFDQITNAEVNVGISDKLFGKGSGSIRISTAGTLTYVRRKAMAVPYTLSNISEPYQVFKFFKEVSHAVKTDIQYPNKYRPNVNPGYKTKYRKV